jgi:hypothetical protein
MYFLYSDLNIGCRWKIKENILLSKNKKVTENMIFNMTEEINPALEEKEVLKIFPQFVKYFDKNGWDIALKLSKSILIIY